MDSNKVPHSTPLLPWTWNIDILTTRPVHPNSGISRCEVYEKGTHITSNSNQSLRGRRFSCFSIISVKEMGALFGVGVVWHVGWCGVTSHVGYVSVFSLHIDFISVYCAPTILRTVWVQRSNPTPHLSLFFLFVSDDRVTSFYSTEGRRRQTYHPPNCDDDICCVRFGVVCLTSERHTYTHWQTSRTHVQCTYTFICTLNTTHWHIWHTL